MAGISMEMQIVLYVILIAALAFAGYYIGQTYGQYEMVGAGIGALLGIIISFGIYKWMESSPEQMRARQQFAY